MLFPDVIFFDAVGTLFGVKGSVGEIYGAIARKFNVVTSDEDLDQAFIQNFKNAPKMAFPNLERSQTYKSSQISSQIYKYEYEWWRNIAKSTFTQVGAFSQFQDFEAYFKEMFEFFAMPDAWYIYEDVIPALNYLQDQGVTLGIISNFDHRIFLVLESLELSKFFTSTTISTEVGYAKPDSQIFQTAIAKHDPSQNFWHIGDSFKEDYEGAENAGIQGIWLDRNPSSQTSHTTINSFRDLIKPDFLKLLSKSATKQA